MISSKPADDDSLMLEIMFETASIEVIGGLKSGKKRRKWSVRFFGVYRRKRGVKRVSSVFIR